MDSAAYEMHMPARRALRRWTAGSRLQLHSMLAMETYCAREVCAVVSARAAMDAEAPLWLVGVAKDRRMEMDR